jgi:acyl-CoA reductase-like NAD-dependent aldehyde dehydrogenase
MLDEDFKLLIDGRLVAGDVEMDVVNPANGKPAFRVARASPAQLDQAVAAAKRAFPGWAATPLAERQKAVAALAQAIGDNSDRLARLMTTEQGKPLPEAAGEIAWSVGYLQYYATLEPKSRTIQDDGAGFIEVRRKPLGVVAGITAWNFPMLLLVWKLGPALIAGNTIVLKPAPTTPGTALALGALCAEIFPAGVVNVITDDNDLGSALTTHPDIAKVSFTGSGPTGSRIMASAAEGLKRVTLELGGNDAGIVLEDVDVRETARKVYDAAFLNAGQVCLAIKRVYVHDAIYDAMVAELERLVGEAVVDDGLKQGTTIGPIQNARQFEKLKAMLIEARVTRTVTGGDVQDRDGFFLTPAIVRDARDGDAIVDEEQFGPVLPVIRFTDVEQVLAVANAGPYGLGGSVWSGDTERALVVAERMDTGSVWVNQHIAIGPHIPMAGFKGSGIGVEQADEGLAEYCQIQVVNVAR